MCRTLGRNLAEGRRADAAAPCAWPGRMASATPEVVVPCPLLEALAAAYDAVERLSRWPEAIRFNAPRPATHFALAGALPAVGNRRSNVVAPFLVARWRAAQGRRGLGPCRFFLASTKAGLLTRGAGPMAAARAALRSAGVVVCEDGAKGNRQGEPLGDPVGCTRPSRTQSGSACVPASRTLGLWRARTSVPWRAVAAVSGADKAAAVAHWNGAECCPRCGREVVASVLAVPGDNGFPSWAWAPSGREAGPTCPGRPRPP